MAATETIEQALARAQGAVACKRLGEAGGICRDILDVAPHNPAATALLGIICASQGKVEAAIELLETAVAGQPGVAAWHANLSNLYRATTRIDDAHVSAREAVRLDPLNPDSLVTLSLVSTDLDDRVGAKTVLLRALGLNDQHADAHLALAQVLLAEGEFDAGWTEYEWRNQTEAGRGQLPRITSAPWNGMSVGKGKILLIGDQGYGDTIQFSRFIPLVAQRCEEVLLGCSAEIASLLGRLPGVSRVFHKWNEIPGHAAYCRLSSLGLIFRIDGNSLPGEVPYLRADPDAASAWGARLRALCPYGVPRIGIAWSGRPTHPNDRRRSMALRYFGSFVQEMSASFVCLQKQISSDDAEYLASCPAMIDVSKEISSFDDTAAIIENLDLIITVDTAVGHLAGALGKPTWILLPKSSDWRWLLDRTDSPWYPTVRLFRQAIPGAWDEVLHGVEKSLRTYVGCFPRQCAT